MRSVVALGALLAAACGSSEGGTTVAVGALVEAADARCAWSEVWLSITAVTLVDAPARGAGLRALHDDAPAATGRVPLVVGERRLVALSELHPAPGTYAALELIIAPAHEGWPSVAATSTAGEALRLEALQAFRVPIADGQLDEDASVELVVEGARCPPPTMDPVLPPLRATWTVGGDGER